MTRPPQNTSPNANESSVRDDGRLVCGIVMPISQMTELYPAEHWKKVREILEIAVKKAGFEPNVVWDNDRVDIIQSKILQNLYDNEIIICDLSNLNPNVMFEAGLRLSTKKPTILVMDSETKAPFDLGSFQYMQYQKSLEFNTTTEFITLLADKMKEVHQLYNKGLYKSYVDSYKFEVATPGTIDVPSTKVIMEQLSKISLKLSSYEEKLSSVLAPADQVSSQMADLSRLGSGSMTPVLVRRTTVNPPPMPRAPYRPKEK
ncbi:hypothetical protein [Asaia astilbis]|uniref:hypothetical protein n=1 Tax=Asaia astilbis TaxID=610244 RepID=UPI0012EB8A96|nr:hypothetical protein [Asaia astilbis]